MNYLVCWIPSYYLRLEFFLLLSLSRHSLPPKYKALIHSCLSLRTFQTAKKSEGISMQKVKKEKHITGFWKKVRQALFFVQSSASTTWELFTFPLGWKTVEKSSADHSFSLKTLDINGHQSDSLKGTRYKGRKIVSESCFTLNCGNTMFPLYNRPVQAKYVSEMEIVLLCEVFSFNVTFSSGSSARRCVFWKMCLRACSCITGRSADLDPVQQKGRCQLTEFCRVHRLLVFNNKRNFETVQESQQTALWIVPWGKKWKLHVDVWKKMKIKREDPIGNETEFQKFQNSMRICLHEENNAKCITEKFLSVKWNKGVREAVSTTLFHYLLC